MANPRPPVAGGCYNPEMSVPPPPVEEPALPGPAQRGWQARLQDGIDRRSDLIAAAIVVLGFAWRAWLAHATFFNTDEAWHYSVANQSSVLAAYKASLTLAHPPLMVLIVYVWKQLGSSDLTIRMPGVVAGTLFCWIFYKWLLILFGRIVAPCGLILAVFLPPLIVLSAELRQYSWVLLFAVSSAYFLEQAFSRNSARMMVWSSLCLWLAMLSHYSAFLFAASLGTYAMARMIKQRPSGAVFGSWLTGQAVGIALAAFLYATQVARLGAVYPGDPLRRFGDFYLSEVYYHAGKESLPHFLYRGTFGVFRFLCAQRTAGHLTTILFLAGIVLCYRQKGDPMRARVTALLLTLPFFVNWIAVIAGLYPYGRTRQCVFLAIFGLATVSVALTSMARNKTVWAVSLAGAIVACCHLFGTPHSRDTIVTAEQKHAHMENAIQFIRSKVSPADVLFTDKPTSFQLMRYLCGRQPVSVALSTSGFDWFVCDGIRVISTALNDGSLTPQSFPKSLRDVDQTFRLSPGTTIWVVQAAWSMGLGESLRLQSPEFADIQPRVFDRYIEVFQLPMRPPALAR